MVTSDFRPEVEIRPFCACTMKKCNITLICGRIAEISTSVRKSRSRNMMVTSDFRPEVKIWLFRACAMHPAIIIGTVRSLWTWLWGRYHVPQNVFLVIIKFIVDNMTNKHQFLLIVYKHRKLIATILCLNFGLKITQTAFFVSEIMFKSLPQPHTSSLQNAQQLLHSIPRGAKKYQD